MITAVLAWACSAIGLFLSHVVYIVVMNIVPYDLIHDPWIRASIEPSFLFFGIPLNLMVTGLASLLLLALMFVFRSQFLKSTHLLAGLVAIAGAVFANTKFFGPSIMINLFIFGVPIAMGTWLALSWLSNSIANERDGTGKFKKASTS